MKEGIGKNESLDEVSLNCSSEGEARRHVSRNLMVKKHMAEQLIAMGLSKESVARILHLRLRAKGFYQ